MATENKTNIWIMKPTSKSQGKGIFLFNRLSSIQEWADNPEVFKILDRQKHIFVKNIYKILY